jgi:hypothetical protein
MQKINNGPESYEKTNVNKLIGLINFPKSEKSNNLGIGSGLISSKNKYGLQKASKKISYNPVKIETGDFGYAVLGSEKLFIISNSSQIPGYPKVQLKSSEVYGIEEPTLSGNFYESTNSMVRGESLKELLNLMVTFLLKHTHMYHRATPYEYTHENSPVTKSQLQSEFDLFDSKVLNQNIRIN